MGTLQSEGGSEHKVSNMCDRDIEMEMVPTHLENTDKAPCRQNRNYAGYNFTAAILGEGEL